jgi:D-glycero-alpha-D-manno-heptose-7-phosphate kinase
LERIFCKSPTRVDLAGGTLDMWPLYNFVDGATTINVAIDIWTTCEIVKRDDQIIKVTSDDLKKTWQFDNISQFFGSTEEALFFYQAIFQAFHASLLKLNKGFEIKTSSQSPIGGGLGGSSSLVISVLKALHQLLNIPLPSSVDLVHTAHNIEAKMLRTPTGTQDYFAAVTGGISFIDYNAHEMSQAVFEVSNTPIKDYFLLVYTGKAHHSGLNNFEVLKSSVQGEAKVLNALKKIKVISDKMKLSIANKNWNELPQLFREEYKARLELTPAFSSPEIEKLNKICTEAGADAVKICGAGGGGCVLVWVSPENRSKVLEACKKENFNCLPAQPVDRML